MKINIKHLLSIALLVVTVNATTACTTLCKNHGEHEHCHKCKCDCKKGEDCEKCKKEKCDKKDCKCGCHKCDKKDCNKSKENVKNTGDVKANSVKTQKTQAKTTVKK